MNQFKLIWINAPRQEYENKRNETASHNKYSKIVLIVMNILLCNPSPPLPPLTYSLIGISSSYEK